jgi:hypothetical protein
MLKLLSEYKSLKQKLTDNVGDERSIDELGWNEGILEAMENLLEGVDPDIAKMIRLNHI